VLYVQLDANWPDNEKVMDAGMDGAGLHAVTMCLAKRLESDGWVKRRILVRYGATDELIDRLVDLELLESDGPQVRPHDWLDRNPSQAAIDAIRASKIEAGKKGNHNKWEHPHPFESCPKCHPEAQVVAECDRVGSQSHRTLTKSESSPEVPTAIAASVEFVIPDERRQLAKDNIAAIRKERYRLEAKDSA